MNPLTKTFLVGLLLHLSAINYAQAGDGIFHIELSTVDTTRDTIIYDRSPYVCTVNLKNPNEENTFDSTIFSREVFIGKQSEIILLKEQGVDFLSISLVLTDDEQFNIGIHTIDSEGNSIPSSATLGSSKRTVSLFDFNHDISVSCLMN